MNVKCLLMRATRPDGGQWQRPWQTLRAHDLVLHIQLLLDNTRILTLACIYKNHVIAYKGGIN